MRLIKIKHSGGVSAINPEHILYIDEINGEQGSLETDITFVDAVVISILGLSVDDILTLIDRGR
jgi:hypothetical protein